VYFILKTLVTNIHPQLGFYFSTVSTAGDEGAPCAKAMDDDIEFIWKI
jgi:hypothetical protein